MGDIRRYTTINGHKVDDSDEKVTNAAFVKEIIAKNFADFMEDMMLEIVRESEEAGVTKSDLAARIKSYKTQINRVRKKVKGSIRILLWEI